MGSVQAAAERAGPLGTPHLFSLAMQVVRLNPSLQDTWLSRNGEAGTRTDTCAWGGAGPRPQARQCMGHVGCG